MFERYTEKARRVIFFSRYEASQYGCPRIEIQHLLLGLLREDRALTNRLLPLGAADRIRAMIDAQAPRQPRISTSVDLPLSDTSKNVLTRAAKEADQLQHKLIGTGHIALALAQEKPSLPAEILQGFGADYGKIKELVTQSESAEEPVRPEHSRAFFEPPRRKPVAAETTIRLHNVEHDLEFIRSAANWCRSVLWHWTKKTWQPQHIAVHRPDGRISFDLSLAEDTANFQLVQNGWNHDVCTICGWKLYVAAEPERSTGYTNGKVWVCLECYEKFLQGPDYFATTHPEIT